MGPHQRFRQGLLPNLFLTRYMLCAGRQHQEGAARGLRGAAGHFCAHRGESMLLDRLSSPGRHLVLTAWWKAADTTVDCTLRPLRRLNLDEIYCSCIDKSHNVTVWNRNSWSDSGVHT